MKISLRSIESAKSHAWRALRVYVLACSRGWYAYVLACLRAWRAFVVGVLARLTCSACLRAQRACVLTCLVYLCACVHACCDEMFYFLTCLSTWCTFLS